MLCGGRAATRPGLTAPHRLSACRRGRTCTAVQLHTHPHTHIPCAPVTLPSQQWASQPGVPNSQAPCSTAAGLGCSCPVTLLLHGMLARQAGPAFDNLLRWLQAQDNAKAKHCAAAALAHLARTPACRDGIADAALPALIGLVPDFSNPACSEAAADAIALLAASPALLPRIRQDLSGLVAPGLGSSLKVRAVQLRTGCMQDAAMELQRLRSASRHAARQRQHSPMA